MSGNSSEMATVLSPNRSSMVSTWPPGSVIRLVSSAPSTEVYQAAAAFGSRVTRWQVSELIPRSIHIVQTVCIDESMGRLPPWRRLGHRGRTVAGPFPLTGAAVLRAIVENWRTDPRLEALWTEQMQTFTDATVAQINADPRARERLAGQDIPALASALTWLGERLYYLAAAGTPPFDDQDTLVATLLHIWTATLYAEPPEA